GHTPKALLRTIARRHIGPEISLSTKRGFTLPACRWLVGEWRDAAQAAFADSVLERCGWIAPGATLKLLREDTARGAATLPLWRLFILECWLRSPRRTAPVAEESRSGT